MIRAPSAEQEQPMPSEGAALSDVPRPTSAPATRSNRCRMVQPDQVLALQRSLGNRAATRVLLARAPPESGIRE